MAFNAPGGNAPGDNGNQGFNFGGNVLPGTVFPYFLPEGPIESPFEPITFFAIQESGRFGPLNEEDLKKFVLHKFDQRMIKACDLVMKYNNNIEGVLSQLHRLRHRINEIKESEKDRTERMKERIKELEAVEKNLDRGLQVMPRILPLSSITKEAIDYIGSQGPLNKDELIEFITTGRRNPQISRGQILSQLKDLRLRIGDNADIGKYMLGITYKRLMKAINDIITELLTYIQ